MTCEACGLAMTGLRCACGWKAPEARGVTAYVIQHCARPGCHVAIRVQVGYTADQPVCKWCTEGRSYRSSPVAGMPHPDRPWPWLTDPVERERRLRMPFWRERFASAARQDPAYRKWVRVENDTEPVEQQRVETCTVQVSEETP